jgi:hypothetical protein
MAETLGSRTDIAWIEPGASRPTTMRAAPARYVGADG